MYHALSLANHGHQVDLVGFCGHPLPSCVATHQNICTLNLMHPVELPVFLRQLSFVLHSMLRVLIHTAQFVFTLLRIPHPAVVLVQTPPAVPTLAIVHFICFMRRSHLVIDWHNLGFTLLRHARRPAILCKAYEYFECCFGRGAAANFCVSRCMQEMLHKDWGISAVVLHDKPQELFKQYSPEDTHALFLGSNRSILVPHILEGMFTQNSTPFTFCSQDGKIARRILGEEATMGLVVSSTSWTEDENFDAFFQALSFYDLACEGCPQYLPLLVVVTGDGPKRSLFEQRVRNRRFHHVHVRTGFLNELRDYAILLSSAHIGISMHTSSSGIDLPMKVVDMLGCRLPVVGLSFPAFPELLTDGANGFAVPNEEDTVAADIARHLIRLIHHADEIRALKANIDISSWQESWDAVAWPIFERLCGSARRFDARRSARR